MHIKNIFEYCANNKIHYEADEDIVKKAEALVKDCLGLDTLVVNAMRTPFRNNRPGIIKIQFSSINDKITVLQNKMKLQENISYRRVRSSQTRAEGISQHNTQTLLQHLGMERRFWLTGKGRLMHLAVQERDDHGFRERENRQENRHEDRLQRRVDRNMEQGQGVRGGRGGGRFR